MSCVTCATQSDQRLNRVCEPAELRGAHSVPGAVQLLPLLSQLLDDVCADLLRLVSDAAAPLDALGGVVQGLVALEQQRPLGLLLRLQDGRHRDVKETDRTVRGERVRPQHHTHTLLVLGCVDAVVASVCLVAGGAKARAGQLHVSLQFAQVPAVQTQLGGHGVPVGGRRCTQLLFHPL